MMNVIKCVAIDDEPMALSVISCFCERKGGLELTVFTDPEKALEQIGDVAPDLVFLDIEMGGVSGIEVAKRLPSDCAVIFTTAYSQYALDGYDIGVVDFLHKPFSYARFEKAVEKADIVVKYIRSKKQEQVITVKEGYFNVPVPVSEILYVEAMNNYCRIFRTGNVCTQTRMPLKSLVNLLPPTGFIQVHRSFVVAADKISGFNKKEVNLSEGKVIPVGRQYVDSLSTHLQ